MSVKIDSDVKKMSFESALGELEKIVANLENGNVELDKAIDSYTRGTMLKEHCQKKLSEAKLKIDKITGV